MTTTTTLTKNDVDTYNDVENDADIAGKVYIDGNVQDKDVDDDESTMLTKETLNTRS